MNGGLGRCNLQGLCIASCFGLPLHCRKLRFDGHSQNAEAKALPQGIHPSSALDHCRIPNHQHKLISLKVPKADSRCQ